MIEIDGYILGRLLGKGAFGETYKANKKDKTVAIKLIREDAILQGFDANRFKREVHALKKAIGPHVVDFIEAGMAKLGNENRYYLAMEFLEGLDLAHAFLNVNKNFDESDLKDILIQIVNGLETIHNKNIVHRDLKPANVFLTKNGQIKLLDFGLVKMLDYTTLTTTPGQPIGTPQYIAPEILRGDDIDHRADFYSFGVLIYHLVTSGKYPFKARMPLELYAKVVNNPPLAPTHYNRELSSEFENFILTLLSKQSYQRTFNHNELIDSIKSTPISIPSTKHVTTQTRRKTYKKRCFFRLLHTERNVIEDFINSGSNIDGIVYQASYLPRYKNSLNSYRNIGIKYIFDPVTYRLTYSSFSQTEGLVNLPYVFDQNSVLSPNNLQTIQDLQRYTKACIDWQMQWNCSTLLAPFHFCRDLGSPWIDIDIKLIEEAKAYVNKLPNRQKVYAGLCINIETYTISANRLALLNRYSRARADGYLFYVDNLDERTNNPLQIRALLDLLRLFQRLGKPVIACRVGTLGLGLIAAGIDGTTSGIASLSSFSESNLLVNRALGYDMSTKYYIPDMMLTLQVPMAEDILSEQRNRHLRCNCPFCKGNYQNLRKIAKAHFLYMRTNEIKQLNSLQNTQKRLDWYTNRVKSAIMSCDNVRRQQIVHLQTGHYSHLRTWLQVFDFSQGVTP